MKRKHHGRGGTKVKNMDGLHLALAHLYPKRTESEVFLKEEVDITNLMKYIKKNSQEKEEYTAKPFHFIVQGMGKLVYHRPLLNRFISGREFYDRDDILLAFLVKEKFEDDAGEKILMMKMEKDTTLEETSQVILGNTRELRRGKVNEVDLTMEFFAKLPRVGKRIFINGLNTLDYFGRVPASLRRGDPNFASVFISNLGSIKCDAPYHHLNNYGTNSIFLTVGEICKKQVMNKDGEWETRHFVNIGATIDERIADGFYFAKSLNLLKFFLKNPELLEEPIGKELPHGL